MVPLADFPQFGLDTKKRFMVVLARAETTTGREPNVANIRAALDSFVRSGFVLEHALTPPTAEPWRAVLRVRAKSREDVQARLSSLASSEQLEFEMHEIEFDMRELKEIRASAPVR